MGAFIDKAKGKIKQAVGGLTGNDRLRREGEREELKGEVKEGLTDVKDAAKGAVKDAKHALKEATKK
jgi:uncharacterized protein YjbJ (UPF0337 family)